MLKKSVLIPFDRYQYYQSLVNGTNDVGILPLENGNEQAPLKQDYTTTTTSEQVNAKLKPELILTHLPKRNKARAQSLLSIIDSHPSLDWNARGELLINKQPVEYSHITDLLHDALNNTKYKPVGCDQFYEHLGNVPTSLITNPIRKQLLGGKRLPPPGTPAASTTKSLNDWSVLWQSH